MKTHAHINCGRWFLDDITLVTDDALEQYFPFFGWIDVPQGEKQVVRPLDAL